MLLDSKGVSVKAKSDLYSFGTGLPDAEVKYLATVVKKALSCCPLKQGLTLDWPSSHR